MLEGEIAILTALQSANLGHTNFFVVLVLAFLGTQILDWTMFLIGRNNGRTYLRKRPKLQAQVSRLQPQLDRYGNGLLLVYRFLYGFRYAVTLLFGLSTISTQKFALFSLLSTTLWLSILGIFGHYLTTWLGIG